MKARQLGGLRENHFGIEAENNKEKELLTNFMAKYSQRGKIYVVGFSQDKEHNVQKIGFSIDRFDEV